MTIEDDTEAVRIGELARRSGLTVRALHHYDAIGLLVPSERTRAGHRLYSLADVRRLYRVVALRRIGMSLDEVARTLDDEGADIATSLARHIEQLDSEISDRVELRDRLTAIADALARKDEPSLDDYLQAIERNQAMEQHYTPQQLEKLAQRRAELGEQAIRDVEDEWPRLYAAMQAEMDRGAGPEDEEPQRISVRMRELIAMFHGGDEGIKAAQSRVWQETPREAMLAMLERQGVEDAESRIPSAELEAFCGRAHAAARGC